VGRGRRRGRRAIHRDDPIGGSVPGAGDDDRVDREDPIGGSVPGADDEPLEDDEDDPVEPDDPIGGSVPGDDDGDTVDDDEDPVEREDAFEDSDDPFAPALPFAARLYEPPAPISATVARAASGRCFLFMSHSFVW
jgi:hypothetical protein